MQKTIDVNTGEMMVHRGDVVLRSMAIGSCVAIAVYDRKTKNGGFAHIMLPGWAPENCPEKTRYACDSIEELLKRMVESGSALEDLNVCLVGAGNVLEEENDTICESNIQSVSSILKEKNIPVRACALGGYNRKSAFLDCNTGSVSFTEGDSLPKILWGRSEMGRKGNKLYVSELIGD